MNNLPSGSDARTDSTPPGSHLVAERVVPTMGIHNCRDYGGYPVVGGGHVAWGRLVRSADHAQATAADLEIISGLGFGTVIDLRGASERVKAPCRRPPAFDATIICSDGETTPAPHASAAAQAFDAASARRNMLDRYADVPFRPYLGEVYRRYFAALAATDRPSLVYCSAGKDRTGLLVALLHHVLGVHWDDVMSDYLLTNTAGNPEERIATLRLDLERRFGAPMTDEAVRIVSSVFPEFLQTSFDVITARYGNVDRYLAEVLDVTAECREALVARLVVAG